MLHFPLLTPPVLRPCIIFTIIFADIYVILPFGFAFIIKLRRNWLKAFLKMLGPWLIMWTKYCVEGVFIVKPNLLTLIALSHPWRSVMCYSIHYPLSNIHYPTILYPPPSIREIDLLSLCLAYKTHTSSL